MSHRVDDSIRKRNKLAVEKRNQWRNRYHTLVGSIKTAKRERNQNPCNLACKVQLEGLQTMAMLMMRDRALITFDLRDSASEWV
jgi:hypothetical protein